MKLNVSLIMILTCLLPLNVQAKCYEVASSDDFSAKTSYNYCTSGKSQIRLNPTQVGQYPSIANGINTEEVTIQIETSDGAFEAAIGSGWGGRGGYRLEITSQSDALVLAKAINNSQIITISAKNNATGENFVLFSDTFKVQLPQDVVGETKAAPSIETSQSTVQKDAYPIFQLPKALTSVKLIAFPEGKETVWRTDYVNKLGSDVVDKACEEAAFPFRRSHAYWSAVDDQLKKANFRSKVQLDTQSAKQVCKDSQAASAHAEQLLGHPKRAFERVCDLLNNEATYQDRNLLLVNSAAFATACYDFKVINAQATMQCQRSYLPNIPKEKIDSFCNCVGNDVAEQYKKSGIQYNSKTLTKTHSMSQQVCSKTI